MTTPTSDYLDNAVKGTGQRPVAANLGAISITENGAMPQEQKPTPKQLTILKSAAANRLGIVEFNGPRGLAHGVWHRMLDRMCAARWMKPYVHGGYEITDEGRAIISEATGA